MRVYVTRKRSEFETKVNEQHLGRFRGRLSSLQSPDLRQIAQHGKASIGRFLDIDSKSEAARILSEGITSIPTKCIRACVLSSGERNRFHTWGIYTRIGSHTIVHSALVFRRHVRIGVIELSLIATSHESRGSGLGRRLVEEMIRVWREESFQYVLTFADVTAMGFFQHLGFRSRIPMPRDLYDSWIDKYSNSVLMCASLFHSAADFLPPNRFDGVEVLVNMENVDRRPSEKWIKGFVIGSNAQGLRISYTFELKTYEEWMPVDSVRLRLIDYT
jgi:GNAT superfamily N-acetyltransferase